MSNIMHICIIVLQKNIHSCQLEDLQRHVLNLPNMFTLSTSSLKPVLTSLQLFQREQDVKQHIARQYPKLFM